MNVRFQKTAKGEVAILPRKDYDALVAKAAEADEDAGDAPECIMKRVDHMLIRSPLSCAASPSTHAL